MFTNCFHVCILPTYFKLRQKRALLQVRLPRNLSEHSAFKKNIFVRISLRGSTLSQRLHPMHHLILSSARMTRMRVSPFKSFGQIQSRISCVVTFLNGIADVPWKQPCHGCITLLKQINTMSMHKQSPLERDYFQKGESTGVYCSL